MKKHSTTILKGILVTSLSFLLISPVSAQKEKGKSLITQDQINKINEIVKPLKDQFNKQLNGDKTYAAYLADVRKISEAKTTREKSILSSKLEGKYLSFFQKLWSAAKIDEKTYQDKIRAVFPGNLASLIHFEAFLCFSFSLSDFTTAPPPPPPPDICLDICTIAEGSIVVDPTLISGGDGNYGNCYLKANAWAGGLGTGVADGYLKNGITIPGTLPDDSRKLRVKKRYELNLDVTAFAVAGGGESFARLRTYANTEELSAYAPVLWVSHSIVKKTMSEEYILEKRDVSKSQFMVYAGVASIAGSGSWSVAECNSIKWSICEEK